MRPLRILWLVLSALGAVVLLLIVAGVIVMQTEWFREIVRDRLVDAITANLHDRDWYVTRRYATRPTATAPTRYVICVRRRNSL